MFHVEQLVFCVQRRRASPLQKETLVLSSLQISSPSLRVFFSSLRA